MLKSLTASTLLFCALSATAASTTVMLYSTNDKHQSKGTILLEDSPGGLMITPTLHDLPPGPHGFHVHTNAACGDLGLAAGGHFDPGHTNKHKGPYKLGHAGDLPVLYVNADGEAKNAILAPHLTLDDIRGRSLVVHAQGDNYTDSPPSGGGGPRIVCGVIR